ncbi:MAG: hypothetical protein HN542_10385 [Flavobacteriales bacterium]|jgi:tetratricopeptide (TPR) repeat protein|nr:hypothetical protein [Flavobacteriales bacterium]MBT3964519.1 hypothetical protein [Flavobacteriales bacterium]MBT4705756.1 hypothetical protein [Flavobacteriales bacterium]MBT4930247.1 hypothetical protein [Flavobacteriales bacterium]MBT5132470.1 hypothetical protein [Flavobacteriales bacterium]
MKRHLLTIVVLFMMIPVGLRAQLDPVSLALRAYQNKDLPKARELIEIATGDDNYNNQAKTWYFRGYIYKDIYSANKQTKDGRESRQQAIESFFKAVEYDTKEEFKADCYKALNFLAATLYNEAARALDSANFDVAVDYFEQHKEIQCIVTPGIDWTERTIDFKLYMASKYSHLFDNPRPGDDPDELGQGIIRIYNEVLDLDSDNVQANYNLAIHYYNQGVSIIENMDYELDFEELFAIQATVMELFGSALPNMLKAYKLNPYRKETLVGLSGIYFGLNDIESSEHYQEELKKLEEKEQN